MIDKTKITEEVRALDRLDLDGLRAVWARRYGPAPELRSTELMRLSLAWRMQADAFGGLDAATRRRLRNGSATGKTDNLSVGVHITKEWRGQTYEIDRIDSGYRWQGEVYPSLSALALAITGVKRNGPRFFGLREPEAA